MQRRQIDTGAILLRAPVLDHRREGLGLRSLPRPPVNRPDRHPPIATDPQRIEGDLVLDDLSVADAGGAWVPACPVEPDGMPHAVLQQSHRDLLHRRRPVESVSV